MSSTASRFDPTRSDSFQAPLHARSMLVVDDDEVARERLVRALREKGLETLSAGSVRDALSLARGQTPAYAVVELRMPDGRGLDLIRELRALDARTRTVVLTGWGSIATAVEAVRAGADNVIPKPADADDVLAAFQKYDGATEAAAPAVTEPYVAPTLARMEWEHIQRVLSDAGGNISESARRLGIHRRSLQRKLQRLAPQERSKTSA